METLSGRRKGFADLNSIVEDPIACGYLRAFCQLEHNAENLDFWIEVDRFKDVYDDQDAWKTMEAPQEDEYGRGRITSTSIRINKATKPRTDTNQFFSNSNWNERLGSNPNRNKLYREPRKPKANSIQDDFSDTSNWRAKLRIPGLKKETKSGHSGKGSEKPPRSLSPSPQKKTIKVFPEGGNLPDETSAPAQGNPLSMVKEECQRRMPWKAKKTLKLNRPSSMRLANGDNGLDSLSFRSLPNARSFSDHNWSSAYSFSESRGEESFSCVCLDNQLANDGSSNTGRKLSLSPGQRRHRKGILDKETLESSLKSSLKSGRHSSHCMAKSRPKESSCSLESVSSTNLPDIGKSTEYFKFSKPIFSKAIECNSEKPGATAGPSLKTGEGGSPKLSRQGSIRGVGESKFSDEQSREAEKHMEDNVEVQLPWPSIKIERRKLENEVQRIYNQYLSEQALTETCCPHIIKMNLLERMGNLAKFGPTVFDECLLDPLKTLERDILPRFFRSSYYKELLRVYPHLSMPATDTLTIIPINYDLNSFDLEVLTENKRFELHEIMQHQFLFNLFQLQLEKKCSVENLFCVHEINHFEYYMANEDTSRGKESAFRIYRYFIQPGSTYEVSTTALCRKKVEQSLCRPTIVTFKDIKSSALVVLQADFREYQRTAEYQCLARDLMNFLKCQQVKDLQTRRRMYSLSRSSQNKSRGW
eukprot:CAMPEP_0117823386 /NCGR_PEP_ID=MMETSP0949-20121206/4249_1 /TAXON_ID=44440 /ORGANISM="Chattonella subsalsa, Strain CCMP2191" /LENGTH=701 /DNA_ID=CAMNT_0005662955 /DNA_START=37 /DNA_END=2139 /DNA_ORIENTATION=+